MNKQELTRRRFLVAVIALSTAGPALRSDLFASSRAWAASSITLDPSLHESMVRMARLLFPHDALPDETYADVLDQALSSAATSDEFAAHLEAAAAALDARSDGDWSDMPEAAQIKTMQVIEAEPFFVAIQNQVRAGIYFHPAFWELVGYPGPSKDFGGYLNRGAGDIDWLPEDP